MKPALVLSTSTAALGVIRSLGRRGVPVIAFYHDRGEVGWVSRWVHEAIQAPHPEHEELWSTDISWREAATDLHLDSLVARGLRLYWVNHHRTAIDRRAEGYLAVRFTEFVLDETYAASRLLFEYVSRRGDSTDASRDAFSMRETVSGEMPALRASSALVSSWSSRSLRTLLGARRAWTARLGGRTDMRSPR